SSVSRNSGRRETPAASNVFRSSHTDSFSSTAMMSARGTITSTTRSAPKRRMRSSISRSSAEKVRPSPAAPLSASSSIARSVGAPGRPSLARRAASQLCEGSGAVSAAPAGAPSGLSFICLTLLTLMAVRENTWSNNTSLSWHRGGGVGIGDADRRKDIDLQELHRLSFAVRVVIVAQEMQQAVNDEMLDMLLALDPALVRLQLHRLGCQHHVAQVGAFLGRSGRSLEREREHVGSRVLAAI